MANLLEALDASNLKAHVELLTSRATALETDNGTSRAENKALNVENGKLQDRVTAVETKIVQLEERMSILEERSANLAKALNTFNPNLVRTELHFTRIGGPASSFNINVEKVSP